MKRFTLVALISFLIIQCVNSQNFISEDKQWNVKEGFWGDIYTEIFKMEGDTVINAVTYQKVWQCSDSAMVNWWLMSFVREDSDKVYFLDNNENEHLLYDFTLTTGDTAYIASYFCDEIETVIYGVDTVNYLGIDRKRWALDDYGFEYWIEGIGSNFGLMYSRYYQCIFDVDFSLLCYYQDDTLEYMKEGEDECFQFYVGIADKGLAEAGLSIYPNPVYNTLTIELPITTSYKYTSLAIFNLNGQQIDKLQPTESKTIVDVSGLTAGVYFVKVTSEDGVQVVKFVKE